MIDRDEKNGVVVETPTPSPTRDYQNPVDGNLFPEGNHCTYPKDFKGFKAREPAPQPEKS